MSRVVELIATVSAGAAGAALAALAVGASLSFILPAVVAVALVSLYVSRAERG